MRKYDLPDRPKGGNTRFGKNPRYQNQQNQAGSIFPRPTGLFKHIPENEAMLTNHFEVKLDKIQKLYEYRLGVVRVDDNAKAGAHIPRKVQRRVVYHFVTQFIVGDLKLKAASDFYDTLIMASQLPEEFQNNEHIVNFYDDWQTTVNANPMQYKVTIKSELELPLARMLHFLREPTHPSFRNAQGINTFIGERDSILRALNIMFTNKPNLETFQDRAQQPPKEQVTTYIGSNKYYSLQFTNSNRTFYGPWDLSNDLKNHYYCLPGYFCSARAPIIANGKLLLNVNTTTSAFFRPQSLSALIAFLQNNNSWSYVQSVIRGIRVQTTYLCASRANRGLPRGVETNFTISGFPNLNRPEAGSVTISIKTNGVTTSESVQAYFNRTHPNAGVNNHDVVVSLGRCIIPAKLLQILPGAAVKQKMDMTETAVHLPYKNKGMILGPGRDLLAINDSKSPFKPVAIFPGLDVLQQMCRVTPKILNGPIVEYRTRQRPNPAPKIVRNDYIDNGSWNLRETRFCRTGDDMGTRVAWSVLQLTRGVSGRHTARFIPRGDLYAWYGKVSNHLAEYGLPEETGFSSSSDSVHELEVTHQGNPTDVTNDEINLAKKIDEMRTECKLRLDMDLNLIFVLLPHREPPLYALVKRVGDQTTGMRTVCHVYQPRRHQMSDPNDNLVGNLAQKVNIKICSSGVNQRLSRTHVDQILTDNTMLMGADVTHAGFGALAGAPSIAAVVGSVDECFAQFPASLRLNPRLPLTQGRPHASVNEQINELDIMVAERINRYKDRRGKFPKQLIFFRDGLSEAQLDMCRNHELPLIRQGITQAKGASTEIPDPKILLICTIKRHHKRFYSEQDRHDKYGKLFDQNGNPRPGCMIDNTVVNEAGKDFFLYSHAAIKGTAKPTHYVVLQNDNNDSMDHIAAMTHSLCYLYQRSARSVSLAPPAYYADLAADRARCYVRNVYNPFIAEEYDPSNPNHGMNLDLHRDLASSDYMFYI